MGSGAWGVPVLNGIAGFCLSRKAHELMIELNVAFCDAWKESGFVLVMTAMGRVRFDINFEQSTGGDDDDDDDDDDSAFLPLQRPMSMTVEIVCLS